MEAINSPENIKEEVSGLEVASGPTGINNIMTSVNNSGRTGVIEITGPTGNINQPVNADPTGINSSGATNQKSNNITTNNSPPKNQINTNNQTTSNSTPKNQSNTNNTTSKSTSNTNNISTSNTTPKNQSNTDNQAADEKPFYHYTQSKFWDGPTSNWTVLKILSIFPLTGILGLDHLYLRSPFSALLKTIFNVVTFGMWYFYDVAQVIGESERVKKFGMSYPIVGPVGLGAGIFKNPDEDNETKNTKNNNDKEAAPSKASPITFLIYSLLTVLPIPFALDHFFVGDYRGGLVKIFANFNIFLFIFSIFWTFYTIFRLIFQTEKLFNEGVARFFPFTLFMDSTYCTGTKLGPKEECKEEDEDSMGLWSFFKSIFATLKGIPVLGGIVGAVEKIKEVYDQYAPPIISASTNVVGLAPKVAMQVTEKISDLKDTDKIMNQARKQAGGALSSERGQGPIALVLFVAFAGIALMGVFLAKLRDTDVIDVLPKSIHSILRNRITSANIWSTNKGPNDTPPKPGAI